MQESEQQAPLTPEDIKKLQSAKTVGFGCLIIVIIIVLIIGALVVASAFIWAAKDTLFGMPVPLLATVVALIVGGLLIALFLRTALDKRRRIKRDLAGGVKKVLISPMESQEMKSQAEKYHSRTAFVGGHETGSVDMSYFVKVKGKDYEVPIETYMAIKPGELVEVHLGIHSDTVLRIVKGNQASPVDPNKAPDAGEPGRDSEATG